MQRNNIYKTAPNNRTIIIGCIFLVIVLSEAIPLTILAQTRVDFLTQDSIQLTADLYLKNVDYPYIILLHGDNSSRGEYLDIAPKLLNLGYNCMAVDLRAGNEFNGIKNESSQRLANKQGSINQIDCIADIEAAIDFAYAKNHKPVVLVGSNFSASLALMVARNNNKVRAVVALSPGDYFTPKSPLQQVLKAYDKPAFVSCSQKESAFVIQLTSNIPDNLLVLFTTKSSGSNSGTDLLNKVNPDNEAYWLNLLLFFDRLNKPNFYLNE